MSSLPTDMPAIEIRAPGGPEMLVPVRRPVPTPGPGEVLVKVAAAGVNRPDILQRLGVYPPPPGASDIPGLEIAGTVIAWGPGVTEIAVGAEVCALVAGGGYAGFCTAPVPQCLPIPRGLSLVEAASLPETLFTVWSNVADRGRLTSGEAFLVHGGTSGIGVMAIQLARALGAKVLATAGGQEKVAACVRLGAHRGIDYKSEDFVSIALAETGGRGVDLILDMVCGDYLPRDVEALAVDGRLVMIAQLGGREATLDFTKVMVKRLTITGSTLRARPVAFKGAIADRLREVAWPFIEAGTIKPVVHKTFPLAEAAAAHALMESGAHIGKIMLSV